MIMKKPDEVEVEPPARTRSRVQTASTLKTALKHLLDAQQRVSIAAVATAAGVTPALIHNKYPDIAESIREQLGKGTRAQRDAKHADLLKARASNKDLRAENAKLLREVGKLASLNEMLRRQFEEVSAVAQAKNVIPMPANVAVSRKGV